MIWPIVNSYGVALDPIAELRQLNREMNQLFGRRGGQAVAGTALNVWAQEDKAVAMATIPGLAAKDLSITVEGRLLVIEGERPSEEVGGTASTRRERATGHFQRQVRLPFEIAADQVSATCERGLVTITLPRSEQSKPRKIAVIPS